GADCEASGALVGFMVSANKLATASFTATYGRKCRGIRDGKATMSSGLPELSLLETRVLGVLVEKQRTVPDTYPLTLNALAAGCSQKTSRDPVMSVRESDVRATIDHLRSLSLAVESSGERVMRYAHNIERVLDVPSQSVALL